MRRKTFRKRAVRVGLVASNVVILLAILGFVLYPKGGDAPKASAIGSSSEAATSPLDQVSSADIALTIARVNSLPESTAINNQAQSQAADVAISSSTNNVTSKPEVVTTALKSKADIKEYTTVGGDNITNIAAKFGVTSDSIRWSNGLSGDTVPPGTKISIPPVNGIVYVVKAGDTLETLAAKFNANKDSISAYNDAEISGLPVGQQIIIPSGTITTASVAAATAAGAAATTTSNPTGVSFPWGSGPLYGVNGYDYGYCTWYVATQISVPGNWGNAATWAYYAGLSGWKVSGRPTPGAIAQKGGGFGHVAIVTDVSPDGSQIKYKDMNGIAGWGRVGQSDWVSVSRYQNFISH